MIARFISSVKNYFFPPQTTPQIPHDIIFSEILPHLDDVKDILHLFQVNKEWNKMMKEKESARILIFRDAEKLKTVAQSKKEELELNKTKIRSTKYPGNFHYLLKKPSITPTAPSVLNDRDDDIAVSGTIVGSHLEDPSNHFIEAELQKAQDEEEQKAEKLKLEELQRVEHGTYADLIEGFKRSAGFSKVQIKYKKIHERYSGRPICSRLDTLACKFSLGLLTAAGIFGTGTSIAAAAIIGPQCDWMDNFKNDTYTDTNYNETIDDYVSVNVTYTWNDEYLTCPNNAKVLFVPILSLGYSLTGLSLIASTVLCARATYPETRMEECQNSIAKLVEFKLFLIDSHSNLFLSKEKNRVVIDIEELNAARARYTS